MNSQFAQDGVHHQLPGAWCKPASHGRHCRVPYSSSTGQQRTEFVLFYYSILAEGSCPAAQAGGLPIYQPVEIAAPAGIALGAAGRNPLPSNGSDPWGIALQEKAHGTVTSGNRQPKSEAGGPHEGILVPEPRRPFFLSGTRHATAVICCVGTELES